MKSGIVFLLLTLSSLCVAQNNYSYQSAVDTVIIKSSRAVLEGIVIGQVGSTDTIRIWDTTTEAGAVSGNLVANLVVSGLTRDVKFGLEGLNLRNGLVIGITGTAGKYTFVYK